MALYLKLFAAFTLSAMVLAPLMPGAAPAVILISILYGVLMSALFGTIQHRAMRGKKGAPSGSVHHQRTIELDMPYGDAFLACMEAALGIHGSHLREANRAEGILRVRVGINLETYGEVITLRLRQLGPDITQVQIESRPRLRTALIDYGRNLDHVNRLSRQLRQRSASDHLCLPEAYTAAAQQEAEDWVEQYPDVAETEADHIKSGRP